MKRAALYLRVSTVDRQNPETQGIELRQFTRLRGYEVVQEYVDHGVSRTKVRRPALEQLLNDAHRRKFDAVLVWLCDRRARSTEHFLQVLDELGIQFYSQREAIDTEVPLGRAIDVDRKALVRDRVAGMSLTCVAKKYGLSRASVVRFVHKGKRCQGTASPLDTKVESQMYLALEEIELGFVVNLETLREVLNGLSVNGRRWWIASDPSDALESHTVTVGHGDRACVDRLNTLYFRVPVINEDWPMAGTNKLILLLDCSVISAEQAGLYIEDGRVLKDEIADLEAFFDPIQRALLVKLQSWIIPS